MKFVYEKIQWDLFFIMELLSLENYSNRIVELYFLNMGVVA